MTAPVPPADEARITAQLARFYIEEQAGTAPQAIIKVGPYTAFMVIASLQLASRHPDMSSDMRHAIRELGRQLQPLFTGQIAEVLEAGWDPGRDIPGTVPC